MLDKKTYLEELRRYFNSVRYDDYKDEFEEQPTDPTNCIGVACTNCIFNNEVSRECMLKKGSMDCMFNMQYIFDAFEALEKWSKENPPKKYKISQLEYDILDAQGTNVRFSFYVDIRYLLSKGYFKGATSDMCINDYLENCEVISND